MSEVRVAVLLCTYNGAKHIKEQLDSIANQGFEHIDIWVSDDGSTDTTLELLKLYKKSWKKGGFTIKSGPRRGFAHNFMSLVCDPQIEADYYAYSDQDDIWERDKLSRSIKALPNDGNAKAAMYCSRTSLMTGMGEMTGIMSPLFSKPPHFRNALVQSLAGGNTMVINAEAKSLLCQIGVLDIVSHDWWTYLLVTGVGGEVMYDVEPSVRYRQHEDNEIGANVGWSARMNRIFLLLTGRFRQWNEINVRALEKAKPHLTNENQKLLEQFVNLREASFFERLKLAKNMKLYRQTLFGDLALIGATLFKRL